MMKWLSEWYNGKMVVPESHGFVIFGPHFEYHWTARIARALVAFYLRKWEWIWTTLIAVASLWVAVLALKL